MIPRVSSPHLFCAVSRSDGRPSSRFDRGCVSNFKNSFFGRRESLRPRQRCPCFHSESWSEDRVVGNGKLDCGNIWIAGSRPAFSDPGSHSPATWTENGLKPAIYESALTCQQQLDGFVFCFSSSFAHTTTSSRAGFSQTAPPGGRRAVVLAGIRGSPRSFALASL
jgi:hypothetical protein